MKRSITNKVNECRKIIISFKVSYFGLILQQSVQISLPSKTDVFIVRTVYKFDFGVLYFISIFDIFMK